MDSFALLEEIAAGRREPEDAPHLHERPKAFLLDLGFSALRRTPPDEYGMTRFVARQPASHGSAAVGLEVCMPPSDHPFKDRIEADIWQKLAKRAWAEKRPRIRY